MSSPLFPDGYVSPACPGHATSEERVANPYALAREEDGFREVQKALPVACWSWTVTAETLQRADEANACGDPERAHNLAWKLLAEWQNARCAVCEGAAERLDHDHDHDTGLVRGWLCRSCNGREGFRGSSGNRFERYRTRNPASILGLHLRYRDPIYG